MHKPQQMKAKLAEKQVFNEKYTQYSFTLVEPHSMGFEPGQYISIVVDDHGDRRSYSICSKPENQDGFDLLIDHEPQGVGTTFFKNLDFGHEVDIMAPLGRFTFSPEDFVVSESDNSQNPVDELVFVATGSGVAPFRSMIMDLLQEKGETRPITLYWGLRYVEDMFWENDFQDLSENFSNFKFHPVISKAVDEWPLCRGRVTDCLSMHPMPINASYYLCGSPHMIEDVVKLVKSGGVKEENVHFEKFF